MSTPHTRSHNSHDQAADHPVSGRRVGSEGRTVNTASGSRIRQLRGASGRSVSMLAIDAGLSASDVADIESGVRTPSLGELWKLAAALRLPFARLLGPGSDALSVSRGEDAEVLLSSDGQLESRPLIASGECRWVEAYALTLAPGAEHKSEPHPRGTQEMVVVLSGVLVIRVGDREWELGPTDSMLFAADVRHGYANPGTIPGRYHNVIVYDR